MYQMAENLTEDIQTAALHLEEVSGGIDEDLQNHLKPANELLTKIADYNRQIVNTETPGKPANDLRDQRFQTMRELSGYLSFNYTEESDGTITIAKADLSAQPLVERAKIYDLEEGDVTAGLGGKLGGLAASKESVEVYKQRLDDFTNQLVAEVEDRYGQPVFNVYSSTELSLHPSFVPGNMDGSKSLEVADLQNTPLSIGDKEDITFNQYLNTMQMELGADQSRASSQADFQQTLNGELETRRQSVSGVSLDEEMVDLLKHQQLYQAAAKIIQRTDQMLQTVIDMV